MIDILLTRPESDSKDLQNKIGAIPLVSLICPLIKIEKVSPVKMIKKTKFDLIIFTSKNAVRNYERIFNYDLQVFTIGKSTKCFAQEYGFKNVISAKGTSTSIINLFKKKYGKKRINIFHPTTFESSNELGNFFKIQGSYYEKYFVYKIIKNNVYPKLFGDFIRKKKGIIIIFSMKTAESFNEQIKYLDLEKFCYEKTFITISKNIANEIRKLKIKNVIVLNEPYEDNLIKKLKNFTT